MKSVEVRQQAELVGFVTSYCTIQQSTAIFFMCLIRKNWFTYEKTYLSVRLDYEDYVQQWFSNWGTRVICDTLTKYL